MILKRAARALSFTEGFWINAKNSTNNDSFGVSYFGAGGRSTAGPVVTHESAMTFAAVYACVGLISDDIAAMPVDAFQRYPNGRYGRPRPGWVQTPNSTIEWEDLAQQTATAVLLDGNAYLVPVYSRKGLLGELWPLDPRTVDVSVEGGRKHYTVNNRTWPADQIRHIRGVTLPGAPKGLSVIGAAMNSVGLGLAAESMAGKLFANGSALNVVLQTDADLTPDQMEQLADEWTAKHSGLDNAHRVAVLDNGATANRLSMSNEEAQFLQSRGFQVEDVCRWFRVPPFMIGYTEKSTSWGSGLEQQHIAYVIHSLMPRIVKFERVLNRFYQEEMGPDYYLKLNTNALLRGDTAARARFYQTMTNIGALAPNEVREREDLNPVPGLDGHYMQQAQGLIGPDGIIGNARDGGQTP